VLLILWRTALAGKDEISSTERLLNLIRSKNDDKSTPSGLSLAAGEPNRKKSAVKKGFGTRGNLTLGVDFGRDATKMALISHVTDKKSVLKKYANVSYEKGLSIDSPRFPLFLKSVIHDLCGSHRKVDIWSTIPSINVETRYLKIPIVPRKQVANTVFWSYKKDSSIDEKESVFDFVILGDTEEDGIKKTDVIAYTAPKQEIEKRKNIFSRSGYPLTGISVVSFALQNLFQAGWAETGGKKVCTLFIGTDWSRIAIFSKKNLMLSRDIKAGLQSMIEAIAEQLEKTYPGFALSAGGGEELTLVENAAGNASQFADMAKKILHGYIDGEASFTLEKSDITLGQEEVFQMISPSLGRVVRQVERTLDHYYLNFENELVNKAYISGPICSQERLVEYISNQLGISVDYIDPFYTDLPGAVDVSSPESSQERGDFVPAVGMALANNQRTPNFIYTYKEKEKAEKIIRFNRSIFWVAIVLMLACIGYFAIQGSRLDKGKTQASMLQKKLEGYIPRVDQNMILQLSTHAFSERQSVDAFADKYRGMAIISEIIKITPPEIRLANMIIHLGGIGENPDEKREKTLLVDGILFGNRLNFESALAGYMVKLEGSPMFGRPEILNQSFEVVEEKEVLVFTAQVKLI